MSLLKSIVVVLGLLFVPSLVSAQSALEKIIKVIDETIKVLEEANRVQGQMSNVKAPELKLLFSEVVTVNSSSHANFSGGKTREVIKVELPSVTKEWYYRVTVLDIKSNYSYMENETFEYLANAHKYVDLYAPTSYGIDFFILGHSGDVDAFRKTGNNNFRSYQAFTKLNTNTFVGSCNLIQDNLWIGVRNPNYSQGLKVLVEVLVLGYY